MRFPSNGSKNICKLINPMCVTLPNWNWNYSATCTSPNARHHPCPWAGQLRTLNRLGPQNLASLQAVLRYTQHAPTSSSKFAQQPPPLVLHSAVLRVTRIPLARLVPPLAPATICSEGCCRPEIFTESWASHSCCLYFSIWGRLTETQKGVNLLNQRCYLLSGHKMKKLSGSFSVLGNMTGIPQSPKNNTPIGPVLVWSA